MADRSRLRLIRRLSLGFGAGIVGGWLAGLLQKPKQGSSVVHPDRTGVPVAQADQVQ